MTGLESGSPNKLNSLCLSDDFIWRHRSGSTLVQVMAWCLMAPSHYPNQCWLFIGAVPWHSLKSYFMGSPQDINSSNEFEKINTLVKLFPHLSGANELTHWGRVTHICISNLTIIGSDNGLSPDRRQAIIWTNAGILLIGPLGTNFSEILIEILKV